VGMDVEKRDDRRRRRAFDGNFIAEPDQHRMPPLVILERQPLQRNEPEVVPARNRNARASPSQPAMAGLNWVPRFALPENDSPGKPDVRRLKVRRLPV
ncbi:hypothetical protein, partial [Mesorhizobium sp. M2D.F.Ca.ET.223.01.1.1]|uniref:hypothetical protein n=1 Tax=Mesorhizobium sp. M2D.F.Ca.ET.223.01.1.1 TaxID=2563940 RepID=UPI001AEEFFCF